MQIHSRRGAARLAVALALVAASTLAQAQNDDRPVTTGGRTVGIAPRDDAITTPDRRPSALDGKAAPRDIAPLGGPSALIFTIDVRWLAASPYRIERDVTTPIEQAVKSLPGVKSVKSSVTGSRAQTLVFFDPREDASRQAMAIRNRLDQIKRRLPHEASQPLIGWRRDPPA